MRWQSGLALASVVILALVAGCSSSASPAVSAPPAAQGPPETASVLPTATQVVPEASPVTATAVPTAPPEAPSATATPVPTAPTPTEAPAVAPQTQPGLLQEQFCVNGIMAPDVLNLRVGPSTEDMILHELLEDQCRIYLTGGTAGTWREVMVDLPDDEVRGWVSGNFLTPLRAAIDPDEPTVTITVAVDYERDFPASQAPIDAFRLVDAEGLVVGFLDMNGQITVPASLDLSRARVEAEWVDDPYCAWTGQLRFEGFGDRYSSPLEAICA